MFFFIPTSSESIVSGNENSSDGQEVFIKLLNEILFIRVDFVVNHDTLVLGYLGIHFSLSGNATRKIFTYYKHIDSRIQSLPP